MIDRVGSILHNRLGILHQHHGLELLALLQSNLGSKAFFRSLIWQVFQCLPHISDRIYVIPMQRTYIITPFTKCPVWCPKIIKNLAEVGLVKLHPTWGFQLAGSGASWNVSHLPDMWGLAAVGSGSRWALISSQGARKVMFSQALYLSHIKSYQSDFSDDFSIDFSTVVTVNG